MTNIKLIVGLANPGIKYKNTRHNLGGYFINLIAKKNKIFLKPKKEFFGHTNYFEIFENKTFLLIPSTYVNISGKSVLLFSKFYKIKTEEILVAHDELNLKPGIVKIKLGGSNNGHNGLKDIQKHLNNSEFYRLRIGIGHPGEKNKINNFVLGKPNLQEKKLIKYAINESIECLHIFNDINKLINRLHSFKATETQ